LIGPVQQSDKFIGGGDIKGGHPSVIEPILDRIGWIEQLQFNVMIVRPPLEVRQHSQPPALNRIDVRKLDHDNPRSPLREDSVTQTVSSFTLNNASLALDNSNVTDYLDMYVEHGFLRHTAGMSTNHAVHGNLVICTRWESNDRRKGRILAAIKKK